MINGDRRILQDSVSCDIHYIIIGEINELLKAQGGNNSRKKRKKIKLFTFLFEASRKNGFFEDINWEKKKEKKYRRQH